MTTDAFLHQQVTLEQWAMKYDKRSLCYKPINSLSYPFREKSETNIYSLFLHFIYFFHDFSYIFSYNF